MLGSAAPCWTPSPSTWQRSTSARSAHPANIRRICRVIRRTASSSNCSSSTPLLTRGISSACRRDIRRYDRRDGAAEAFRSRRTSRRIFTSGAAVDRVRSCEERAGCTDGLAGHGEDTEPRDLCASYQRLTCVPPRRELCTRTFAGGGCLLRGRPSTTTQVRAFTRSPSHPDAS